MKRKNAQRKRQAKASSSSRPGTRASMVPARTSAATALASVAPAIVDDACLELDAVLPRDTLYDSGEIAIPRSVSSSRAQGLASSEDRPRLFGQVDLHTESNFFSGYSGDLSDGGVFVVTYAQLKLGQPVEVELSLPGGLFISGSGHVAFLRAPTQHNADLAPGAGIVFDDLDAAARRAAEVFMLRREPTFVDPS